MMLYIALTKRSYLALTLYLLMDTLFGYKFESYLVCLLCFTKLSMLHGNIHHDANCGCPTQSEVLSELDELIG